MIPRFFHACLVSCNAGSGSASISVTTHAVVVVGARFAEWCRYAGHVQGELWAMAGFFLASGEGDGDGTASGICAERQTDCVSV
jgi:hypothetical protein